MALERVILLFAFTLQFRRASINDKLSMGRRGIITQQERHPELTTGTGCQLFHPYSRVQTLDLHSAERCLGPGRRLRKKSVTRSVPVARGGRETDGRPTERVPTLHFPQAGARCECSDVVPAPHEAGMEGPPAPLLGARRLAVPLGHGDRAHTRP